MSQKLEKAEISVIIPFYNAGKYLAKALDSIVIQDMCVEVIVVDDASSSDDAIKILDKYRKQLSIRYIRNKKNMGAAWSRNTGVQKASTKYIAFLDADDWWKPGKLKKQMEIIQKTGTVMTYTGRMIYNGNTVQKYKVPQSLTYEELLKCNYIACSSVLIERKVALEFPMSNDPEIHEDYLNWLEIVKKYGKIYGSSECFLNYLAHRDSRSGNKIHSILMRIHTYRKAGISRARTMRYNLGYYGRWLMGFRKETV